MRALVFLLSILPLASFAQYAGPAVDACLAYAAKDIAQTGAEKPSVVFERDASLALERYARKAGSQFVSSLLVGNGALVYPKGLSVEMTFLCLLASDRQAVFFDWRPRRDAPALAQCGRGKEPASCLESLLLVAEQDLTTLYSRHFIEARQADAAAGNEERVTAFRKAADAFKVYRDAECARRGKAEVHAACMVEMTRRRAQDLR